MNSLVTLNLNWWVIIMAWLAMAILIVIAWFASRKISWIPSGWQNVMEYVIEFIENIVKGAMGEKGVKYTYFFGSLFLFILITNMLGLIPGLTSPTKDLSINFALAIMWLIWMQYIGIRENGLGGHLKHYLKPFAPFVVIHLMEMVVRPLTLSLRLFGNIMAGEILLEKLTENFHFIVPSAWIAMSIFIGGIQAFIFTVLSVSYTGLAIAHDDESGGHH